MTLNWEVWASILRVICCFNIYDDATNISQAVPELIRGYIFNKCPVTIMSHSLHSFKGSSKSSSFIFWGIIQSHLVPNIWLFHSIHDYWVQVLSKDKVWLYSNTTMFWCSYNNPQVFQKKNSENVFGRASICE